MRNPRTKQNDWSKAFKVVFGRKQFELLQVNEGDNSATTVCQSNKKQTHQDKKQQIVVPKIEIVKRITEVKKFSGVPFNYLRVRDELNLPKLYAYELNQVDHSFLKTNQHKYILKGKKVLTAKFMEKAFIELESKLGKQTSIPKAKTWMLSFIEKQYKELLDMENLHQFAQLFYSYWRNRRQDLRFPLLRPLWRPNPDEFNHLLAFKVREKQKRNLRRGNRINDDQIGVQLAEEFQNAKLMSERIMAREQTKLQQIKIQILQFHSEIKSQMSSSQNKQLLSMLGEEQMKKQKITERLESNKERLKRFQKDLEFVKKKKQVNEEQQYSLGVEEKNLNIVDNRQSAINFLATVINYADTFGVSYESVFHTSQQSHAPVNTNQAYKAPYVVPPALTAARSATQVNLAPIIDDEPIPVQQKGQYFTYELYLQNSTKTVFRKFTDIDQGVFIDPQTRKKRPKNNLNKSYFEQKSNQITKFYFGDDDEGDFKDLKKNISISFKKFMQITKNGQ